MRFFGLVAALAVLSGCATPCANAISEATTRSFACEDGSRLQVTFNPAPSPAHLEQVGYAPLDLTPQSTASGYRFVQGGAELRGTLGGQAYWSRPGAEQTLCREEAAPTQTAG